MNTLTTVKRLLGLIGILALLPCALISSGQHKPVRPQSSAPHKLVGSWQAKGTKQTLVFLPGGIGKNPDGSRFSWRLEGDYMVAQALGKERKPKGEVFKAPIVFTQDGKEYSQILESGNRRTSFSRLLATGQIDRYRSKLGGAYRPDKFGPKKPDDDEEGGGSVAPGRPSDKSTPGSKTPPETETPSMLPSIAVNKAGVVGVCWYDTRDVPLD